MQTIETLLEKITPLPYRVGNTASYASEEAECGHSIETSHCIIASSVEDLAKLKRQAPYTFAYLVHCANNFPKLLEALELTHNFHNRYFTTQSLPEFQAVGYTGTENGEEMKQWLFDLRLHALTQAREVKR